METGNPWLLCGLSKNNKKIFNHNSGPSNGTQGSSTAKCTLTTPPWDLFDEPLKCLFKGSYTAMGSGRI